MARQGSASRSKPRACGVANSSGGPSATDHEKRRERAEKAPKEKIVKRLKILKILRRAPSLNSLISFANGCFVTSCKSRKFFFFAEVLKERLKKS